MKEEKFWILLSKKIAGEASPEELAELQEMVNANPAWKSTLENLQEFWDSKPVTVNRTREQEDAYLAHINRLKEKAPDFEEQPTLDEAEAYPFADSKKKPFYSNWKMYAAAAAFIGAFFLIYPFFVKKGNSGEIAGVKPMNEINIGSGSRTRVQLPDGSQVWINSVSKLTYGNSFKGSTREVFLEGEAYFDVVKDAAHPFIVHTSGIDIKVLGTAFNVKAYAKEPTIEATLIHGSIEVLNKEQPDAPKIMLKPHEKLVYNKYQETAEKKDGAIVPQPLLDAASVKISPLTKNIADTAITEIAWVYNKLSFEEERFEDLATRMERWYNLKINFETDRLKNYRISGSFVNETAEEALNELQFLVPFRYIIKDNEVRIMKK